MGVFEDCEEGSALGNMGEMCKCLSCLGRRGKPAARSTILTVNNFNEQF